MTKKPDYYAALGIFRDASLIEIKRAYFEAAQRLHPDKNKKLGETELFMEVQQAYEVLSNPKKRIEYDSSLTPEDDLDLPILERTLYSRQSLVHLEENQLIYVMLEWKSRQTENWLPAPSLNVCLVLDRSSSMKGIKIDLVKAAAIQLVRSLRQEDIFGVIGFSDRAEALIPSGYLLDKSKVEARIQMMTTSGATEMYRGLESGIAEVRRNLDPECVNHVILLTDGHTYGDEQACLTLATEAGAQGIGISSLGIGQDWNDNLLDSLANRTGGSSMFVSMPQDIKRFLTEKINRLVKVFAEETILEFECSPGVEITYAFRIQPETVPFSPDSPLHLGPVLQDTPITVLLEFLIQPSAVQKKNLQFLEGSFRVKIASRPKPVKPLRVRLSRPVMDISYPDPPPATMIQALTCLNLYRMQEKAQSEVNLGNYDDASQRLQHLAAHLLTQGERGLAQTALLEAENVHQKQTFSEEGRKQIKYGTRSLILPDNKGKLS